MALLLQSFTIDCKVVDWICFSHPLSLSSHQFAGVARARATVCIRVCSEWCLPIIHSWLVWYQIDHPTRLQFLRYGSINFRVVTICFLAGRKRWWNWAHSTIMQTILALSAFLFVCLFFLLFLLFKLHLRRRGYTWMDSNGLQIYGTNFDRIANFRHVQICRLAEYYISSF